MPEFHTVREVIEHSREAANYDWDKACQIAEDIIVNDPVLLEDFSMPLIRTAIRRHVIKADLTFRKRIWDSDKEDEEREEDRTEDDDPSSIAVTVEDTTLPPQNPDPARTDRGLDLLGEFNLLNYPMPGGHRLRDATRDELQQEAVKMVNISENYAAKSRWFQLIASKLKAKQKVGDKFSHHSLLELKRIAKVEDDE